jgi:hypothetical protein
MSLEHFLSLNTTNLARGMRWLPRPLDIDNITLGTTPGLAGMIWTCLYYMYLYMLRLIGELAEYV